MPSLKSVWCRMAHRDVAYGGGEYYWCRRCLCRFPVPWKALREKEGPQVVTIDSTPVFSAHPWLPALAPRASVALPAENPTFPSRRPWKAAAQTVLGGVWPPAGV